jgi:hypothetical protein
MVDFLSFRRMITPTLIQLLFAGGSALWLLGSLGAVGLTVFGGMLGAAAQTGASEAGAAGGGLLAVGVVAMSFLVMAIVVLFLFRLYCEVTILFFRMNQTLQDISDKLDRCS